MSDSNSASSVLNAGGRRLRKRPAVSPSAGGDDQPRSIDDCCWSVSCHLLLIGRDSCCSFSPICFQIFREPYSTICGHTFWFAEHCRLCGAEVLLSCFSRECITRSLERRARCPTCSFEMDTSSADRPVFPNFAVAAIADARRALKTEDKRLRGETVRSSCDFDFSSTSFCSLCNSIDVIFFSRVRLR
jgi:hypothetical protein